MQENRIIVLYHRPPYEEVLDGDHVQFRQHEKPNGIIPLLKSFFSNTDNCVWIAASTLPENTLIAKRQNIDLAELDKPITLRRIQATREEINKFYHKSSKEGFWPVLHNFPEKFIFESVDWKNFEEINRRFAEAACEEIQCSDDIIWIHDYNLWLVPYYIRQRKPANRIAFFFHTPFPSADTFNILAWRNQIIESLLSCDFICFDIPRYVENFVATVRTNVDIQILDRGKVPDHFTGCGSALSEPMMTTRILFGDHVVQLDAFPEGTNYELIQQILKETSTLKTINEYKKIKGDKKLIFAASRTDYVKGTKELLNCYKRLLARKKNLVEQVTLFLVSVKPVEGMAGYTEMHEEIESLVREINIAYTTREHTPIRYSNTVLSFREMIAWFSISDVMWIPSLRDGMNIICKEFIVAKESAHGALILSEFAGASVELPEAILANPYSPLSMDVAIDRALSMPIPEQRERLKRMLDRTMLSDIKNWSKQLLLLERIQVLEVEKFVGPK